MFEKIKKFFSCNEVDLSERPERNSNSVNQTEGNQNISNIDWIQPSSDMVNFTSEEEISSSEEETYNSEEEISFSEEEISSSEEETYNSEELSEELKKLEEQAKEKNIDNAITDTILEFVSTNDDKKSSKSRRRY